MPTQILLFTQPRAGGTMLERVLSNSDNIRLFSHAFNGGRWTQLQWLQSDNFEDGMPQEARTAFDTEMSKALDEWRDHLSQAKDNSQMLMVNFHTFFAVSPDTILEYYDYTNRRFCPEGGRNLTIIPEDMLLLPNTIPVCTIADPRVVVPSTIRVLRTFGVPHGGGRGNFQIVTSNIWNHVLYDYYVAHGIQPIVVDADDYMTDRDYVRHLYSRLGLDPEQAYLDWPNEGDPDKHHPMYYASQKSLLNSSGIDPSFAAKNRNLDEEAKKWEDEFGEDLPAVKEMIDLAMPHYEYLFDKRMKM